MTERCHHLGQPPPRPGKAGGCRRLSRGPAGSGRAAGPGPLRPRGPLSRSREAASLPRLFIAPRCFQPKISPVGRAAVRARGGGRGGKEPGCAPRRGEGPGTAWRAEPQGRGRGGPGRAGTAAAAPGSPGMRAPAARRDFYGKLQRRSGGRSQGALGSRQPGPRRAAAAGQRSQVRAAPPAAGGRRGLGLPPPPRSARRSPAAARPR